MNDGLDATITDYNCFSGVPKFCNRKVNFVASKSFGHGMCHISLGGSRKLAQGEVVTNGMSFIISGRSQQLVQLASQLATRQLASQMLK